MMDMIRWLFVWVGYIAYVVVLNLGVHTTGQMSIADQMALPLGTHTWFALWCMLGLAIPAFIRLSHGYPKSFVALTTAICTLAWLSMGMRYAPIIQIGPLNETIIDWISDGLNLASIVALGMAAWRSSGDDSR
ncbi:hypothetical protein BW13_01130 [Bifidobacterium sp. UTCIF-37]|uniref:hypothetical protein n=1 Tax=unclassified Bifidobacterium TaxID=2608897 RepID=UPI001126716A|nr:MULTISPECIES: hypothetical protein [unclassified Bifidobacterium]TPF87154.1 hypothetical protein BW13_01130 [Bifidobacterium sp. UTCIF-37]TPF91259.1 hypothetical protein BW11_01130 [Bifidobacterium sp. UTCIF-38]